MTGHGEAQRQQVGVAIAIEVRTVNNRYLKVTFRTSEGYGSLESNIESVVRRHVRRGSVQVNVRIDREPTPDDFKLNEVVLAGYQQQLEALRKKSGVAEPIRPESLLMLPGVVNEAARHNVSAEADWPLVEQTLTEALENLSHMRAKEGAAMAADLHANCEVIATELDKIEERAPLVVDAYRKRLTERLNKLLEEYEISIQASDVVREVGIFADRGDISEETVRLRSHLNQFDTVAAAKESNGRKLEFLIQEILRETNTIGSKANDAEIARFVVEIKTAIERMREMIQNVE
ncbi:MAG: YicC family protein [Planctomycetes bacterium]|nr:YicC family protein [Planctomycetota bacterium]MBL7044091.1 YicC family protein [Pirellulaceae bacterium]